MVGYRLLLQFIAIFVMLFHFTVELFLSNVTSFSKEHVFFKSVEPCFSLELTEIKFSV